MKKLTDKLPTILPGDKMVWELWEDDDQSPATEPAKKRRAPRFRGDTPRTESEEREMVRDSIRRSLLKNAPAGAEVGDGDVDTFLADVMGLDSARIDDGLGDDSPEQDEPIVPADDEDDDEETPAAALASRKKREKAKAKAAQGPPSKDAFALPRREPRKIPKVTPAAAREPIESKHPTGDAVSAAVAIEEFSNAARAVDSESYGEAARALIRLASMNIPLKVLFQLGDCPKHVKRWAKSGSTGEIRAAANMCVETWRNVVQREEAGNAREAPETEPEPEPEPDQRPSRARARARVRTGSPRLSGDFRVGLLRLPGPVLRSGGCLPRGARGSDDDDDRRGGDTGPRHQRAQREPGEKGERVGAGIGPRPARRRSGFGGRPAAASHPRTSR